MRKSPYIVGIDRDARFLMLPLPSAMATMFIAVLPFIWFKTVLWPFTYPIWWGIARFMFLQNPHMMTVFKTWLDVTFPRLFPWPTPRRKGRTYANG